MLYIQAPGVPAPAGHYSHAVKHGGLVMLSGVLPSNKAPDGPMPAFAAQAGACLDYCRAILAEAGCTPNDVLSCTIYITDIGLWPECNAIYAAFFGEHRPARAVVPVPCLHHGFSLEVQMTAAAPEENPFAL